MRFYIEYITLGSSGIVGNGGGTIECSVLTVSAIQGFRRQMLKKCESDFGNLITNIALLSITQVYEEFS